MNSSRDVKCPLRTLLLVNESAAALEGDGTVGRDRYGAAPGRTERAEGAVTPEERFEALVEEFAGVDGVLPPGTTGGRFGAHALRVRSRIFAMLVRGRLVVKLPRGRVDALVAAGQGVRFDANKGTPMKEWLSLDPDCGLAWPALA